MTNPTFKVRYLYLISSITWLKVSKVNHMLVIEPKSRRTDLICREWIYGRISESLAIKLNLYSFVWKGFGAPVKSSQIMWNHTGECNCRQPYDEWRYSNPSTAAPFLSSPVSADTPGPCVANHIAEHRAIIRRAPCTLCHMCPFSVRMIICKWHRAVAEVCYLKWKKKLLWCCGFPPRSKVLFSPFSFRSL